MIKRRRFYLARAADIAILASFLALSVFAYDRLFAGIGETMTASGGIAFTDLYRPGQNPWAGAIIVPDEGDARYASLTHQRRPFR